MLSRLGGELGAAVARARRSAKRTVGDEYRFGDGYRPGDAYPSPSAVTPPACPSRLSSWVPAARETRACRV